MSGHHPLSYTVEGLARRLSKMERDIADLQRRGNWQFDEEVAVDATTPSTDRALSQNAYASNQYDIYAASRMVDGDDTTNAITTATQPAWLKVDLGAAYEITEFRVVNSQFGARNCNLQSSTDDTLWTDRHLYIPGSTITQAPLRVVTTARFWRLLNTDGNGLNIATLNLFENGALWVPISGQDVAQGASISQTNTYSTYEAYRAIDSDDLTEAIAQTSSGTAIITVDLLTPVSIASYRVKDNQFTGAISLEFSSNGSSWSSSGATLGGELDNTGTFGSPINARYWRITKANTLNVSTFALFAA